MLIRSHLVNFQCNTFALFVFGCSLFIIQKQPFADILQNRCFYKFRKFHRKRPVLQSHFNQVARLKASYFIKKRHLHRCFPVKFAKLLRTPFFTKYLPWLLLIICLLPFNPFMHAENGQTKFCCLNTTTFSGPFRGFSTRVWQNARSNTAWRAMVCYVYFLFSKIV